MAARALCATAAAAWLPGVAAAQRPGDARSAAAAGEVERVALAVADMRVELRRLAARVGTAQAFVARPALAEVVVMLRVDSTAGGALDSASAGVDDAAGAVHRYNESERAALRAGGSDELYRAVLGPGARTVRATVTIGGVPVTRTQLVTAPPDGRATVVDVSVRGGSVESSARPAGEPGDGALRTALFELESGRPAAALARLSPTDELATAPAAGDAGRSLAARVLMVEALARLGDDAQLERVANGLLDDPAARVLAPALRTRLSMTALARGDDAAALRLTTADARAADGGPPALVAGLAQLRSGGVREARAAFARARRAGGVAAPYAAYADAVAAVRADSGAAPAALDSLVALVARAEPAVAGRAGVTAAQLAYELGRYQQAALLAAAVRSPPAVGDALLVRGWALYKDGAMSEAAAAFDEHAREGPARPTRGEAELIAAQALLVAGRTPEAGRRFRAAADSATAALEALERGGATLSAAAAASLLERGAVGDLWMVRDGLTLGAPAGRMFDAATLAAVLNGATPTAAPAVVAVVGTQDSAGTAPREGAAQARLRLAALDPARAVAVRRELAPALRRVAGARAAAQSARAAAERDATRRQAVASALAGARRELAVDRQQIATVDRRLTASAAALRRVAAPARARSTARRRATAAVAETTAGERARGDSLASVVEELRLVARTAAAQAADAERRIELLAAGTPSATGARQTRAVASAEAERVAAEAALAAAVTREMEQRRAIAVAGLRRDVEAAEFASASAAFFAASGGGVPRPVEVVRPTRRPAPTAPPAP